MGLLALLPLFALLMLLCTLDSGYPIFIQRRVGRVKKIFLMIKFRTMKVGTRTMPTHEIDNSKITRLGIFLRQSKLDELPQLWNVLKGDMSIVGPRPCLESQLDVISERNKRGVFDAKPGMTGDAQLFGIDMSEPEKLSKTDEKMIASFGIKNYFRLIYLTIFNKVLGVNMENKK